ncbi:MAG: hypothetical protein WCN95_07820 [bacterium]
MKQTTIALFLLPLSLFVMETNSVARLQQAKEDNAIRIDLGPSETVLADNALGLRAFPDGRISVIRTKPECRVILAAGVSSFLLEGPDLRKLTKATKVLDKGKQGDCDNGYAGINAVMRAKAGELLAIYHAEDQEGMQSAGSGIPGFYCSVAMAVSRDDGTTFEKRGPVITGQVPKNPKGTPDQGVGEPCLLAEPTGKYLYAYYTSHERMNGRNVDICLARCLMTDAMQPGVWKKFHAGGFNEPGLGGKDTPVLTTGQQNEDAILPYVFFVPELRQFVMLFCLNAWREGRNADRSGIYVGFSDDGISWSRERMQQIWKVPVIAREGVEVAWHPTFIPDETGGTRGWLYYGYSSNWGWKSPATPHYLARRRIEIRKQNVPTQHSRVLP